MMAVLRMRVFSLLSVLVLSAGTLAAETERLDFNVFLDDKKIGTHIFELETDRGVRQVRSVANFKYTVFFIPAYRYAHTNEEQWSGNCLLNFNAKTNTNGKRIDVSGMQDGGTFRVDGGADTEILAQCVVSFAYWNAAFLNEQRLLNQQTGKYVDIEVKEVGTERIEYRGDVVSATRFELASPDATLTLWYSAEDEWLALESVARGGRMIRYERV